MECLKSWHRLQLGHPEIVVSEALLDVNDEGDRLDAEQPEDEDVDSEIM